MFVLTQNKRVLIPIMDHTFAILPPKEGETLYKIDAINVNSPNYPELTIGYFRTEQFALMVLCEIGALIDSEETVYMVPEEPEPSLLL